MAEIVAAQNNGPEDNAGQPPRAAALALRLHMETEAERGAAGVNAGVRDRLLCETDDAARENESLRREARMLVQEVNDAGSTATGQQADIVDVRGRSEFRADMPTQELARTLVGAHAEALTAMRAEARAKSALDVAKTKHKDAQSRVRLLSFECAILAGKVDALRQYLYLRNKVTFAGTHSSLLAFCRHMNQADLYKSLRDRRDQLWKLVVQYGPTTLGTASINRCEFASADWTEATLAYVLAPGFTDALLEEVLATEQTLTKLCKPSKSQLIEVYGSEAEHRDRASNDEHKEEDGAAAMDVDDARAEAALRREIAAVRAEREAVDAEIARLRAAEP